MTPPVGAQQSLARHRPTTWPGAAAHPGGQAGSRSESSTRSVGVRVVASALVPGAGQALERRWLAAAAFGLVEAAGWWVHLDAASDADRFRDAYRDLAWSVARGAPSPRVDGPFEYYERMIRWTRSGAFDADPGRPGVQPERAPDAFNGRQWRLAAEIFLGGDVSAPPSAAGYDRALAWYRERAYGDAFLWDWTGAEAEQIRFADLIDDTDGASRRASLAAGALVANHVLGAVEAFLAHRLGRRAVELDVVPPSRSGGRGATLNVRVLSFD